MSGHVLFRSALALSVLAFLASCAELPPPPSTVAPAPMPTPMPYTWNGDAVPGAARIVVHIGEQRAYFFKGKTLVGETAVSTGKSGFSTPPGQYRVVWKNKDHISTRFGDYVDEIGNVVVSNVDSRDRRPPGTRFDGARMPYAMFFRGGYAMHQGYVPPYAASHGCIRLPPVIAELFFNAAPLGTAVHVKQGPVVRVSSPPIPVHPPPLGPAADFAAAPRTRPPIPVRAPSPTPVPNLAPVPRARVPVPVRAPSPAPAPVRSPSPASVRPTYLRSTIPAPASVRSPAPAPVRSPAAVRSVAPASIRPTPAPVLSRTPGPGRPRVPVRRPAPSPTPTPARR